jgi:hypothetical protein
MKCPSLLNPGSRGKLEKGWLKWSGKVLDCTSQVGSSVWCRKSQGKSQGRAVSRALHQRLELRPVYHQQPQPRPTFGSAMNLKHIASQQSMERD